MMHLLDTLFQHADDALYESKRNGRNQATLYEVLKSKSNTKNSFLLTK
ncbi:hypothetical protein [Lysinibacillus sp. 2017]|nr:hypothetical protein [Lysinibacillus sp. 2017]